MSLERVPHDPLVLAEQLPGFGVAEALGEGSGAFDIGEEDGVNAAGGRGLHSGFRLLAFADELFH